MKRCVQLLAHAFSYASKKELPNKREDERTTNRYHCQIKGKIKNIYICNTMTICLLDVHVKKVPPLNELTISKKYIPLCLNTDLWDEKIHKLIQIGMSQFSCRMGILLDATQLKVYLLDD